MNQHKIPSNYFPNVIAFNKNEREQFEDNHVGMDEPYVRTWARMQGVGA